ncbi:MAG: site-specific DNA-methyltransferase [Planctomycetia bacterium]|nr:site-specific DNA-methyltransferase [Planctomycetia bacterium]
MKKLTPADAETRSTDTVAENIAKLKALFPEIVTEGPTGAAVNVDTLKGLVGDGTVTDAEEKYGLNWHGKRRARQLALMPSTGTLRPCPKESVDWDKTQNLMIEGDNLEVLKLLQKSYAGKVKLIYIDPPYNTGDDFVYSDDFQDNIRNYLELTGQVAGGQKVISNTEASGRFHTDWLNMMYPRLKLARNLLRPDGLIFVSIDDGEVGHLKLAMSDVFGDDNFEGHIHWRRRHNQPNDPTKMLALVTEHVLVYARDKSAYKAAGVGKLALTGEFSNPDGDSRGDWASKPWKVGADQSGSRYKITTPTGKVYDEDWMGEEATFKALLADKRMIFPDKGNGAPRKKYFRSEREQEGQCATNWWPHEMFGHNQGANSAMEALLGEKNVFSNPKPIELIDGILSVGNVKSNDLVLDFFAGSGTTGHAVMAGNAADGGKRRYILVQLPEPLDPESKDQKVAADYCDKLKKPRNIAELTKERLRRAAKKIKEENQEFTGDLGFRVFKLDSTNIQEWEPKREELEASLLTAVEHLKTGRSEADIVYELLLKLGLDLCVPIEKRAIAGKDVHAIGRGVLIVCLAEKITRDDFEPLGQGIVKWHKTLAPAGDTTCVFRDSAFADDVAKTNLAAILSQNGIANVRSL